MKRRIRGCFKWLLILFLSIGSIYVFLLSKNTQESPLIPTPTVVVINEIHYNFPVIGIIDYYLPSSVNIRIRPDFNSSSIITTVEDGEEFLLLGITEDGEFFITEFEGQTVFISVKAITIEE